MNKKNIELIVTGVLVLILVSAFVNSLNTIKKKKSSSSVVSTMSATSAIAVSEEQVPVKEISVLQEEETAKLEMRRDPFTAAPIKPQETSSSSIQLNGILWDKTNPMAIINESIVKVGDRVGAYIVVSIKQDSVILNDGNRDFELRLSR